MPIASVTLPVLYPLAQRSVKLHAVRLTEQCWDQNWVKKITNFQPRWSKVLYNASCMSMVQVRVRFGFISPWTLWGYYYRCTFGYPPYAALSYNPCHTRVTDQALAHPFTSCFHYFDMAITSCHQLGLMITIQKLECIPKCQWNSTV